MRLDHIAYRVKDRWKTANFFINALGYKVQTTFDLKFDDGTTTDCIALEPPEKGVNKELFTVPWVQHDVVQSTAGGLLTVVDYHLAPEIFVSDGPPESIVGKWVAARDNIGGIHHLAYQVENVEKTMQEWKDAGYAEFTSAEPMKCPGLTQCFTKPSVLTGVIYEFIERGEHGFCRDNVKSLMESSRDFR